MLPGEKAGVANAENVGEAMGEMPGSSSRNAQWECASKMQMTLAPAGGIGMC